MIMELKHLINNLNDQLGEPLEGSETLSIIIPCYNEEGNILQLYTGLSRHLHEMGVTYMLWFIDDGSTDHTLDVIKELAENNVHIKFVSFSRNFGHQKAFRQTAVHYLDSKRNEGDSKYTWTKMCSLATCGLTAFSVRPLKAAIVFALLFMLFSCIDIYCGKFEYVRTCSITNPCEQ